jgi:hypothetical protein
MCRCHVFVVNLQTFPYHLRYLFAGTTPGKSNQERHISLLADIARTRQGDKVVFYLERVGFFGIFEVTSDEPLYVPRDGYLQEYFDKPLIYRVQIKPADVYAKPVSEWEAIDELPEKSRDILWSLLYRKLKGKRGCSYLFPNESEKLFNLLRKKNQDKPIVISDGQYYTYDAENGIIIREEGSCKYEDSPRSAKEHIQLGKSEADLQAWICWHLGRDSTLDQIAPAQALQWFANEVYAGIGTQKIDILCIVKINNFREFRIIEIKNKKAKSKDLMEQTQRYIWWLNSYQCEPSDKIKVFWIAKDFDKKAKYYADELENLEKNKGLDEVNLLTWKPNREKIILNPYSDHSS